MVFALIAVAILSKVDRFRRNDEGSGFSEVTKEHSHSSVKGKDNYISGVNLEFGKEINGFNVDLSEQVGDQIITGSCGEEVNYQLDKSTGLLEISGSGEMTNFSSSTSALSTAVLMIFSSLTLFAFLVFSFKMSWLNFSL